MNTGGKFISQAASLCLCNKAIFRIPLININGLNPRVGAAHYGTNKFSKAQNLAFIRKWNKENTALFGDKLKVKKKGKRKPVETTPVSSLPSEETLESTQFKTLEESLPDVGWQAPIEHTKNDNSYGHNATRSDASAKETESVTKETIVQSVKPIMHFPLFVPSLEGVNPGSSQDDFITDIPALRDERPVSVSQILNKTKSKESEFALMNWIKNQIETLGKEGHAEAQKERLRAASTFHGCLEQFLTGTPKHLLNLEREVQPYWQSVSTMLPNLEEVFGVEVKINHSKLRYHGTADCLAQYKGQTCVIEWKTSSKPKASVSSLFDYPLQVAAYLGGLHYTTGTETNIDVSQVENMLIVVAYDDGSPAHSHYISRHQSMQFWASWCQRLHLYWKMRLTENHSS